MYTVFKKCGERGIISDRGEVFSLSALAFKMLDFVKPPFEAECPSALRYSLAKYDSGDVKRAYAELQQAEDGGAFAECGEVEYKTVGFSDGKDGVDLSDCDRKYKLVLPKDAPCEPDGFDGIVVLCDDEDEFSDYCARTAYSGKIAMGIPSGEKLADRVIALLKKGRTVWCDIGALCESGASADFEKILRTVVMSGDGAADFLPFSAVVFGKRVTPYYKSATYTCKPGVVTAADSDRLLASACLAAKL